MPRMHRTQIYLPGDLTSALDELARARGTSRAELMRHAAQRLVEESREPLPFGRDAIDRIIGIAGGSRERENVSEQHDKFLVDAEVRGWST